MFFDFFFKYLQCHNILGLWKKYFTLFGKKVSEGLSNLPLRVQQRLLGRKISFDKNLNFLRLVGVSDENFRAFDKKMGGVAEIAIYLSSWSFWENKTLWKELILSLVSDFQREILDLLAKNVLVCVLMCVWEWGLPKLHSACLEKHFDKILVFEGFVVSSFFSILDGNFSIFLHEILAGLFEPPRRRILEARLFWRSFKILELLNFDRKKIGGVAETAFTCLRKFSKVFFERKVLASLISHIQLVVLEHLVENFRTEGCENCIPRVFLWIFCWKTNVLYKCNFSNSFWHGAKNAQTFGNGSAGMSKRHWRVQKKIWGIFSTEKFLILIIFLNFQQKVFKLLRKNIEQFFETAFYVSRESFWGENCYWKNVFEKSVLS